MAPSSINPSVVAAVISAIPATLAATSAWYSAHMGRKESNNDANKMEAQIVLLDEHFERIDTRFEKIDLGFSRMDLRFDTIEDNVERHLGWHRDEAADKLEQTIKKEAKGDNPTNQLPIVRPQD